MKKVSILMMVLLLSLVSILAGCGKSASGSGKQFKTQIQLGTGSPGGTYYPLGQQMANLWNKHITIKGFKVSSVSTGASVENLARIGRGELDLGLTVHTTALDAYNGRGEFKGKAVKNFGFIGKIYPEIMQVVTLTSTGVNSIADLKGKRVAIGPPGSGTQATAKKILAAYGLKKGDYKAYEEGFGDAKKKLQDGVIDATFGYLGAPAASIDELQAVTHKVKFLEITGDPLKTIEKTANNSAYVIQAGTYDWLKKPVNTVSAFSVLVGSTDTVSTDLAYQLAKTLYNNRADITHAQGKHILLKSALNGSNGLPLHPGAKKFYEEVGLIKK